MRWLPTWHQEPDGAFGCKCAHTGAPPVIVPAELDLPVVTAVAVRCASLRDALTRLPGVSKEL